MKIIILNMKIIVNLLSVFFLSTSLLLANSVIPTELPHPDNKPPAKDKPVKVYIMSGQSNMVGFGSLTGNKLVFSSIFLSADPNIKMCRMPVGSSGLLPHLVFTSKEGNERGAKVSIYKESYNQTTDYTQVKPILVENVNLGSVAEKLPIVNEAHTTILEAYIEIPITGNHMVHAGFGDSSNAIVSIEGKEVYRKEIGGNKELTKIQLEAGKRYAVKIIYFKTGSTAFWMELMGLKGSGDLTSLIENDGMFKWMRDKDGEWSVRNDVILCESYLDKNKFKGGRNTPLSAKANGKFFGPELGFGYVMGTFHEEPVLLIKSDIGNRSLGWDCLPPGSKPYEFEGAMVPGYGGTPDSPDGKNRNPKAWYAGKQYDEYTKAIHGVLNNFKTLFPQFKDQGYEVAGFVWWQGHKDGGSEAHISNYEKNLANLIKAWRKEFNAPLAKWVIATVAFSGDKMSENYKRIASAQLAVSGETGRHPEFKENVKTIDARPYWRNIGESPTGTGYHYNHNAETYMLTGDALGRAMVGLYGGKTEPGPSKPRPQPVPSKSVNELTLAEKARLLYTDAFISPYARDDRKPKAEDFKKMGPSLQPMILGKLVPNYLAESPKVPAYRRHGMSMMPVISGKTPTKDQKRGVGLTTQLDLLISYYNAAGIDEYNWKPFAEANSNKEWEYLSFEPVEKLEKNKGNRNRKITLPEGMDQWNTESFNASKLGWKKGAGPFGQNSGRLVGLSESCHHPQCKCSVKPKTLWEHEVLLMRKTFDIPEMNKDARYRLIVGGSAHAFSGEGYSLYLNGKLFSESKGGYYKGKGGARGGYILDDFMPEFKKGKVTIAIKAFLRSTGHKNKLAPTKGHIDVWLEQMKLPAELKAITQE